MNSFLTETATHKNNPTGAATLTTVSSSVTCSPAWPTTRVPTQDYPLEKLFMMYEVYTKYTAFAAGDVLELGSVTYIVRAVQKWEEIVAGGLDDFYLLVVEKSQ